MTATYTYNYLGKTDKGYEIWEGVCAVEAADEYARANGMSFTFVGMALVKGVIGAEGIDGGNVGNPVILSSITTQTVKLMVLETGTANAALDEKTNAEAYGQISSFRCTVYGL